jgi:flagellar motor protein MotB
MKMIPDYKSMSDRKAGMIAALPKLLQLPAAFLSRRAGLRRISVLMLLLAQTPVMAQEECVNGICPPLPDCEVEKLTPEECAAAHDRGARARGAMRDNAGIINPAFGSQTYPPNTEALLPDEKFTLWLQDESLFKPGLDDDVLYDKRLVRDVETVKLADKVPGGIRFDAGSSDIPQEFIDKLRGVLGEMQGRENVRLHFIGHTDNAPLTGDLRAQYADNAGLSAARAQMVAEYFQRELGLDPAAVSFEGRGDSAPIASNDTAEGRARNRRVEVEVWYDQVKEEREVEETIEVEQASLTRINVCRVMQRCIYRRLTGNYARIQVMNAVQPVRYEGVQIEVTPAQIEEVRSALNDVRDMPNSGIRVVAHTDNQPLSGPVQRIYGDNLSLSKALANRVARVLQDELGLRNTAVQSIGKGETAPLASNATPGGRVLNRRIEIEIWHDDPRGGELSEPQPCPGSADAERITARFEDETPIVPFKQGQPAYPPGFLQRVQRILDTLKDKGNVRINFVGHTTNERLSRRAAMIYSDHFALSEERAQRVMDYVRQELKLKPEQVMTEGRGFLEPLNKPDDSPFAKKEFTVLSEEDNTLANPADARVELEFMYDDLAVTQEDPNVDIVPITQEEQPVSPFSLHPIRVTVDGTPVDQGRRHGADMQRCADLELDKASIRLSFDRMRQAPRLNVHAVPSTIAVQDDAATVSTLENKVAFQAYTNYPTFIERAEVRLFKADQSPQSEPVEMLPLNVDSYVEWSWAPDVMPFEGPVQELKYVLRVYDAEGRFDETAAKTLWVVSELKDPAALQLMDIEAERRVAYGENHLALHNIPSPGGTITASGSNVPAGYTVWVLNQPVPVSLSGEFVGEFIIPAGLHSVEVAVLDDKGNGRLYLRDLQLKHDDWFRVGIADLTLGVDDTTGPARLVTGDETHYENESWADGRLAFYTKGKTEGGYTITASADTMEGPVDDMFKNLDRKDPDAIFRRLDPDYYYPTFGDDSVTVDDAPTSGKFYVKAEKNKSHAMWGNFETRIRDTDLAQIDRALYGADFRYESLATTGYGESRSYGEAFVAEPGTLLAREEFRGTGGSLYFLQRRDITQGSERMVIEVRDKDSGIVLQTMTLVYGQDYDIDYIQGRILLNQPLQSTADDELIIRNGALSGNPVFLVARYEYTPGFEEVEDTAAGGRVAHWFGDALKLGATFGSQDQLDSENNLSGVDVTWRKTPYTYVKLEGASTEGQPFAQSSSIDGGFQFSSFQPVILDEQASAAATRLEAVASLSDLHDGLNGQVRVYTQNREAGFAAPGQLTNTDIVQSGISADVPVGERWQVHGKLDQREQDAALSTAATEMDVRYQLSQHWRLSSGVRADEREDDSAIVPLTQVEGKRTDLAFEAAYDSLASWSVYSYVQNTLETTDTRPENNRAGLGGAYQISDRTRLNAEASGGDGGSGGRLGIDYLATDRTNLYLAYNLEHERSDTGVRGRNGRSTAGFRTRYSDTTSVYGEERLSFGDQPSGLTHAYGIDYAPADRWTLGLSLEAGTLEDNETAAQIERTAYGLSAGYNGASLKYAAAVELREDATDLSERNTYLLKNTLSLQLTPDWRTLAKLNLAESESSQGEFYDGNFTEFVLGYGYRPVAHDRLNMLLKYTFFENLPAAEQLGVTGTRADFIQRSNIVALDVTYDLTQRWTLGTKLAQRLGEVALDRTDAQFFESNANLYVLRADWNIVRNWDWLIEARALEVEQAEDVRSGYLTAGYWHLNDNIKLGAGYNFTDFSDDLTDLDFDSQGFFINIIGKM